MEKKTKFIWCIILLLGMRLKNQGVVVEESNLYADLMIEDQIVSTI